MIPALGARLEVVHSHRTDELMDGGETGRLGRDYRALSARPFVMEGVYQS
ncbi:MAG: hypothetical protein ACKV2U_27290 [Bryobacteraceae bacterium]